MEPIHILRGQHSIEKRLCVHLLRQRKLNQDSVDLIPIVECGHQVQHLLGCYGFGRRDQVAVDAKLFAGLHFTANINLRRGYVTHKYRRQPGPNSPPGQLPYFRLHFFLNRCRNSCPIEHSRHRLAPVFIVSPPVAPLEESHRYVI